MKVSAVILTHNEEKNIEKCISSVLFCDEIIVIDDHSTDTTREIIKNLKNSKIHVIEHDLKNNFSAQRNFGLEEAKGQWVLFVDADEIVSEALQKEIALKIRSDLFAGYYIHRNDFIWGRQLKYGETTHINLLRLAQKSAGKWVGNVHEEWKINGTVGQIKQPLEHFPHQTIREFISEIDYYSTLRAQELYEKGKHVNLLSIVVYPNAKFIQNYLIRYGFLDGAAGLIVAILMSFHSFSVRGKLWFLQSK